MPGQRAQEMVPRARETQAISCGSPPSDARSRRRRAAEMVGQDYELANGGRQIARGDKRGQSPGFDESQ